MKKLILLFAILCTVSAATAFGQKKLTTPDHATLQKFNDEFKDAVRVSWRQGEASTIAHFGYDSSYVLAFFGPEGVLLGTARNILLNQLPLRIFTNVNNRFPNYNFVEVQEYTAGDELFYILIGASDKRHIKLRVYPSGNIDVEENKKLSLAKS